jgi:hypothetical protein
MWSDRRVLERSLQDNYTLNILIMDKGRMLLHI